MVVQLGGADPIRMAKAAAVCCSFGYDEININCGCPSPHAKDGSFGAILMKDPPAVANIAEAMIKEVKGVPITVKCRIGVDDRDSFEELIDFIETVKKTGVKHFIVHARKAFLKGLNPKENRSVPPLKHDWVYKLAQKYPDLSFSLNGGLRSIEEMKEVMAEDKKLAGCMFGRLAYDDPWIMGRIDKEIYGAKGCDLNKKEVLLRYAELIEKDQKTEKVCNSIVIKPITYFFTGERDNNKYKRFLAEKFREEKYTGNAKLLIEDAVELFSGLNPTASNKVHS